jgi:hypothetical protein
MFQIPSWIYNGFLGGSEFKQNPGTFLLKFNGCITIKKNKMKKLFLILFIGILTPVMFGQTKTELKPADLPKPITDFLTKNLKNYTVDKAFKVDSKGVITYDLLLLHGADKAVFIFDKDGKFIKRADRADKDTAKKAQETKAPPTDQKKTEPKK